MTELTFNKVGTWYESEAVEVGGDFALHITTPASNTIEILRSASGEDFAKCWRTDSGAIFDMTFTGAVNGLNIKVRSKLEPINAAMTW